MLRRGIAWRRSRSTQNIGCEPKGWISSATAGGQLGDRTADIGEAFLVRLGLAGALIEPLRHVVHLRAHGAPVSAMGRYKVTEPQHIRRLAL